MNCFDELSSYEDSRKYYYYSLVGYNAETNGFNAALDRALDNYYTKNVCVANYLLDGGELTTKKTEFYYNNKEYCDLKIPEKNGYTFHRYVITDFNIDLSTDKILFSFTAEWVPNTYTVSIYGGNTVSVKYDSLFKISPLIKEGKEFVGYYTEKEGKGIKITDKFGNSLNNYNFNANDGRNY
jgi:hypothetical protein